MIRVNKFLAQAGIASRRAADELIARGAVTINGRRAKPGDRVDPAVGEVRVNGRLLKPHSDVPLTVALNKPLGMVTTMHDERGRPCVGELLGTFLAKRGQNARLFPIGRLDAQTTGLLLCTTDGELCRDLTHPSRGVERRYRVTVNAKPADSAIRGLGATSVKTRGDRAVQFEMKLTRGQNREIRRACAQRGLRVIALERIAYGPVELGDLRQGAYRVLNEREMQGLTLSAGQRRPKP